MELLKVETVSGYVVTTFTITGSDPPSGQAAEDGQEYHPCVGLGYKLLSFRLAIEVVP